MDEETLEGNNLMKVVILYLQKNLAIIWGSARTRGGLLEGTLPEMVGHLACDPAIVKCM